MANIPTITNGSTNEKLTYNNYLQTKLYELMKTNHIKMKCDLESITKFGFNSTEND